MQKKILVIEDEKRLAGHIKKGLEAQRYCVDVAYDGEEGERMAMSDDYDLILLDILLPKQNGWQVRENLRKAAVDTPIIMLSARGQVCGRLREMEDGADDFLAKPFDFQKLSSRIEALLQRGQLAGRRYTIGDLHIDPRARTVTRAGEEIRLTDKEFTLLELFAANSNKLVTRAMIAEHLWDIHSETGGKAIDAIVDYLRKKLENGATTGVIETIEGAGYLMKCD